MSTKSTLEWHFIQEEEPDNVPWFAPPDTVESRERSRSRPSRLYELLFGIAILYGLAGYLIWQQMAQRMAVLEGELVSLRGALSTYQAPKAGKSDSQSTTLGIDAHPRSLYYIETDYLHFATSMRASVSVQAVAHRIDVTYQQFYRDFGIPLPALTDKLTILIDPAVNLSYPITNENTLMLPLPLAAAARNGLTLADALTDEVLVRLAQRVLEKALQARRIKPQWQVMTLALQTHLQLIYGYNQDWQSNPTLLAHRHLAQNRSLTLSLSEPSVMVDLTDPGPHLLPAAFATAEPLLEFILETYGYTKIAALLNAFAEYGSWETLSPAVFGVPAHQLEEEWHAYLRQAYPQPGNEPTILPAAAERP